MLRSSSRSSYKTWCTRRSDNEVVLGFCGVVVLLFGHEYGQRGFPPRLWLRLCAVVLRSGAVVLRSGPVVLCSGLVVLRSRAVVLRSGSDLCGSCADLRSGSCRGRSQLLRSGPGCCS
jgi:hypothetical protein